MISNSLLPALADLDSKNQSQRGVTGINPYTGTFSKHEVAHLLRRTTFGITKSALDSFSTLSVAQAVSDLLNTSIASNSTPLKNYSGNDNSYLSIGQTWVYDSVDSGDTFQRIYSLKAWYAGRVLNQQTTLHEKMIFFWMNHFSTQLLNYGDARFGYKLWNTIQNYALGNFKDLLKAICIEPAMLIYLNGFINTKAAPDENFARELQELFTVGKGPNSLFTESDVKAIAKIMTGYKIDPVNITFRFDANAHDTSDKQLSAFYNNTIIHGQSGIFGQDELDQLINVLLQNSETALHICRKLYRFFINSEIDATTEINVIEPLATILRNNNYEIKTVLQTLFQSEHFFDTINIGGMIKSPLEYTMNICRLMPLKIPANNDTVNYYNALNILVFKTSDIGLDILDPPNVSGYPAYYQLPSFHRLWVNSSTLSKRENFTESIFSGNMVFLGGYIQSDFLLFTENLTNPSDPNAIIDEVCQLVYAIEIGSIGKQSLKNILLSGQSADHYWTIAWNNYVSNKNDIALKNIVETRLLSFYKTVFLTSEFHLQ